MNTFTLALVVSLSLTTGVHAQFEGRGSLRPADRERIEAQAGEAARDWRVDARSPSGAVTRVNGRIELAGSTAEERFRDFLARFGPIFDANPPGAGPVELSPLEVLTWHGQNRPRHVRVKQFVRGFEVEGHGLTMELDEKGDGRCVHGIVSIELASVPPPEVSEEEALRRARTHFLGQGHALGSFLQPPSVASKRVAWIDGRAASFYRVEGVLAGSFEPLACDVDARTGEVLRDVPMKCNFFGEGTFKSWTQTGAFKTGTGKGVVYRDFKAAIANKSQTQTLPELGKETALPGFADDGTLFGRFAWVLDGYETQQGWNVFKIAGNKYQFLGFPSDVLPSQADLFDSTNAYYHLTNFALWLTKIAKQKLPTDYAMPTISNVPGMFNAFFTAANVGLGTGPGYIAIGDPSWVTNALADDFGRDPSVLCHEYTHAVTHFSGKEALLLGPINSPHRALGEAISDYFACSYLKDARLGLPLFKVGSAAFVHMVGLTTDGMRNLAASKTMYDNLYDGHVNWVPEEHAAGHIFGATLWRVRQAVGAKVADELIFNSMFNWPSHLVEIGYQVYGPPNAEAAYFDFFEICLKQLVNDAMVTKGKAVGLKVAGAVLSNGAIGLPEADTYFTLNLSKPGTTNLSSGFLGSSFGHLIGFGVNGGQTVDITITGDPKVNTKVDLLVLGSSLGLAFPNQPVKTANSVKLQGVKVLQGGIYGLVIANKSFASNVYKPYKVTIRVK